MGHAKFSRAQLAAGTGRQWKTVARSGNIHFIEKLPSVKSAASPMHTYTKTKVYVSRHEKPGTADFGKVKEISIMNPKTGRKIMDIHTKDEGFGPHFHRWKDFRREDEAGTPLTKGQRKFLEKIIRMAEAENR